MNIFKYVLVVLILIPSFASAQRGNFSDLRIYDRLNPGSTLIGLQHNRFSPGVGENYSVLQQTSGAFRVGEPSGDNLSFGYPGSVNAEYGLFSEDVHALGTLYGSEGAVIGYGRQDHTHDGSLWLSTRAWEEPGLPKPGDQELRIHTDDKGSHFQHQHIYMHGAISDVFDFDSQIHAQKNIETSSSLVGRGVLIKNNTTNATRAYITGTPAGHFAVVNSVGTEVATMGESGFTGPGLGITSLNSSVLVGAVPVTKGGTGLSTLGTAGQILKVNAGGTALEWAVDGGGGGGITASDNVTWTGDHRFTKSTIVGESLSTNHVGSNITIGNTAQDGADPALGGAALIIGQGPTSQLQFRWDYGGTANLVTYGYAAPLNIDVQNLILQGTATGNVGIGNSSPSTKLHVTGTVTATAYAGDGSALTGIIKANSTPVNWTGTHTWTTDMLTNANGSSAASPRIIGITGSDAAGESARFQLGDNYTGMQNIWGKMVQIYAYPPLLLNGGRQNTSPPTTSLAEVGSDAGNIAIAPFSSRAALGVRGFSGQTANLQVWENDTGADLASVSADGSFSMNGSLTVNNSAGITNNGLNSKYASGIWTVQPTGNNAAFLRLVPKGSSYRGAVQMFNTDFAADSGNYEAGDVGFNVARTAFDINVHKAGSGTQRPLTFSIGGNEIARIDSSGLSLNTTYQQINLSGPTAARFDFDFQRSTTINADRNFYYGPATNTGTGALKTVWYKGDGSTTNESMTLDHKNSQLTVSGSQASHYPFIVAENRGGTHRGEIALKGTGGGGFTFWDGSGGGATLKWFFGAGTDLSFYDYQGTAGNVFALRGGTNKATELYATGSGTHSFKHDGSNKFVVNSTGATVTGAMQATDYKSGDGTQGLTTAIYVMGSDGGTQYEISVKDGLITAVTDVTP